MRTGFLIAGLLVGLAGTAWAHVGVQVIPIFELSDEDVARIDVHDGSVDDWLEIVGDPTLTLVDFSVDGSYDPADMDFRLWLGWHQASSRIYVAMEQVDDVYINDFEWGNTGDSFFSTYDSGISFEVDGDHSGGAYYANRDCCETQEAWRVFANRQAQWFEAIGTLPSGSQVRLIGSPKSTWYNTAPYADGGGRTLGTSPTISVTEFYLTAFDVLVKDDPVESRVSTLAPGKVIGLRVRISDYDDSAGRTATQFSDKPDATYVFPPSLIGSLAQMFSASYFADGMLVGKNGRVPEVSAVEGGSWARIKASFGK